MSTHKIKQGDSLWLDIEGDISVIDDNWDNWEGKWAIANAIGDSPIASGNLTKLTAGLFRFKLSLVTSEMLNVGVPYLIFQIENSAFDYREEIIHDKLQVKQQGLF